MKTWVIGFLLLFTGAMQSQVSPLEQWTDAYISALPSGQHFRGNILVEQRGQVLLKKSYGLADESWNIQNTADSRFEIASVTKQFTAVAILQLAESGRLSVQDAISKYYPQAPAAWKAITIEELLNHTSGLPNNELKDFTKGIAVPYSTEELIQTFRERPLVAAPGTKWAYTNTEYYLVAYLIEHLSGEKYGTYLADHIFKPLGMSHSGFAGTLDIVPQMTQGYTRENGRLRLRDYFDRSLEIGAGGIYTTVGDLVIWNRALDAPGFLTERSLGQMFSIHPPGNYGYGWFIDERPVHRVYHEGGDPGFAAFEARYPDEHLLILVLSNEDDSPVRDLSVAIATHLGVGSRKIPVN
jgi:CubicO group peptidase (beta-lactamase class C family)